MDWDTKRYLEDMLNTNDSVNNSGAEEYARDKMLNSLNRDVANSTMNRNTAMERFIKSGQQCMQPCRCRFRKK